MNQKHGMISVLFLQGFPEKQNNTRVYFMELISLIVDTGKSERVSAGQQAGFPC